LIIRPARLQPEPEHASERSLDLRASLHLKRVNRFRNLVDNLEGRGRQSTEDRVPLSNRERHGDHLIFHYNESFIAPAATSPRAAKGD